MLLAGTGYYYQTNYKHETLTMTLNEATKTSALLSVDNQSRVKEGELFLQKELFESKVKEIVLSNNTIKSKEELTFTFDYLANENGSIKALRVVASDGEATYQSTLKVDISEEK